MRITNLFTKTRKESPSGEEAKNAKLLIRGGFIHKEMAGVYSFLPLGWRVINNIIKIVREEMDDLGAQELNLTSLQNPEPWKTSGRWSDEEIDVWFKTKLNNGSEVGLANTHEEALTNIMTHHVGSYSDLPCYVYQFQTKFRNELRAKNGLLRGREFIMKDLYSFNADDNSFREFYEKCAESYSRIFSRCGIGDRTFRTFASGGSFSKYSDEFQTLVESGEDTIYLDKKKGLAINEEVYGKEAIKDTGVSESNLEKVKSVEVGNIFPLGTKYSEPLGLRYKDVNGDSCPVVMGSYGIGIPRLMGVMAEVYGDENSVCWPTGVSPYKIHLIQIGSDKDVLDQADRIYLKLKELGLSVLFDDREASAGVKFSDADLIGIPIRITVGAMARQEGGVEVTDRRIDKTEIISEEEISPEKLFSI